MDMAEQTALLAWSAPAAAARSAGPIRVKNAWIPGTRAHGVVSHNIVANRNKVQRIAKVHLSQHPFNHYNRLLLGGFA